MLLLRVKAHTKNISDSAKHANQKDRLIFISATQAFWREDVSLKDWNTVWIETTLFLRQVQLSYALSLHLVNEEAWKRQAGGGETAWVSSAGRKAMKNRILPLPINLSLSTKKKECIYLYEEQWQRQKGHGNTLWTSKPRAESIQTVTYL